MSDEVEEKNVEKQLQEIDKLSPDEINKKYAEIEKDLADKYGFTVEQVKQMAEIYDSLSLKEYFKTNKELVYEILDDRGKQPIPVAKSQFEVDPEKIEKMIGNDGKEIEVVMKPVFIVRAMTGENKGKVYSRIPSGSEMTGLLKVEYQRRTTGFDLVGAFIRCRQTTFEDKDKVMREGYSVEEIAKEYVESNKELLEEKEV